MKFIGELKKKLEAAASKEEARKVLNDAGLELTDEELASVAGGGLYLTDSDSYRWLNEQSDGEQLDALPPISYKKRF